MAYALGADISHWQDNNSTPEMFDFEKGKAAGLSFVFIKASQGNWTDEDIIFNWNNALAAELLRGAYHFLTWDVNPVVQAQTFVDTIDHDPGELPPVCDYEWWSTTPSNAASILKEFVEAVERMLGRTPIIYTAPGFWNPHGTTAEYWAHYGLWVAHWGVSQPLVPAPWNNWTFWQWTNKGDGAKYGSESKDLDMNYFNGTITDLYNYAGLESPVPSVEEMWKLYREMRGEVDVIENRLDKVGEAWK